MACVQGSSALQATLDEIDGDFTVFAVWEPVQPDHPAPTADVLANLHDERVLQLWDPDLVFSDAMREAEGAHEPHIPQAWLRTGEEDAGVLYDTVAMFEVGDRWEQTLPGPVYVDGGLAKVLPDVRARLEGGDGAD